MRITRSIGALVVGLGLVGGTVLLGRGSSDVAAPVPVSPASTPTSMSLEQMVGAAGDGAALVMLCRNGLHDAAARTYYEQVVNAHPESAVRLGPDCSVTLPER
jgi:hypothetical protein